MISEKILDQILPLPDIEEEKNKVISELEEQGFVITNFRSGGVFYTLLMLLLNCYQNVVRFGRKIINNSFLTHADDEELIKLKAGDFGKTQKPAVKTEGKLKLSRSEPGGIIKIYKNDIFKTKPDIDGEELRFIASQDVVMGQDDLTVYVPIIAEEAGAKYNVSAGKITESLKYIEVDEITNETAWITLEGTDIEDIESLRNRGLNAWADLAPIATKDRFISAALSVPGVLSCRVDDRQPRGQGTVDITIVSPTGEATEELLELVETAVSEITAPDDNVLIQSAETEVVDISVKLVIPFDVSSVGMVEVASELIADLVAVKRDKKLNELYLSDITYTLKQNIPNLTDVIINAPAANVILDINKIIIAGEISVTIEREENV